MVYTWKIKKIFSRTKVENRCICFTVKSSYIQNEIINTFHCKIDKYIVLLRI